MDGLGVRDHAVGRRGALTIEYAPAFPPLSLSSPRSLDSPLSRPSLYVIPFSSSLAGYAHTCVGARAQPHRLVQAGRSFIDDDGCVCTRVRRLIVFAVHKPILVYMYEFHAPHISRRVRNLARTVTLSAIDDEDERESGHDRYWNGMLVQSW